MFLRKLAVLRNEYLSTAKSIATQERNKIAKRVFCIQFCKINFAIPAIQHLLINDILLIFFKVELPCHIVLRALIETSQSLRELIYLQYIWEKI